MYSFFFCIYWIRCCPKWCVGILHLFVKCYCIGRIETCFGTNRGALQCVLLAIWGWDSEACLATRSRDGRSLVRVLVRAINFFIVQNVETCSGYRHFFFSWECRFLGVMLATHFHRALTLKMELHLYSPVCLHGVDRGNCIFSFTFYCLPWSGTVCGLCTVRRIDCH